MTDTPPGGGGPFSGSVTLPGLGKTRKVYAVGGGLVLLGLGYVWYSRRKAATTAAADPIDPATGVPYSQEQMFQPGVDSSGGGGSSSSGAATTADQVTAGPPFHDNAAWSQYAAAQLAQFAPQLDQGAVSSDLGKYLAGDPVTAAERDVINQAIAYAEPPPTAGPHGYPPSINVVGPASGGAPGAVGGLQLAASASSIAATWTAVSGADSYAWACGGQAGTVAGPAVQVGGLQGGTTYTFTVHAHSSGGDGPDASATATTLPGPINSTPPPPGPVKSRTTVHGGERVSQLTSFFGITAQQMWDLNPGLQATLRYYQAGKGWAPNNAPRPGDELAFTSEAEVWIPGSAGW